MPDFTPLVPGDDPYPQYNVTTTQQISDALQITKGVVYTKDAAGRLIVVASTIDQGMFQAKATPTAVAVAADQDAVQVLGPRSRIIMDDTVGGLVVGEDVILVVNTSQVVTGAKTSILYMGKVFEIYTRNTDNTEKIITVANDQVIVETVQA